MFTGQWADLPLDELCKKAKKFGYSGLELACWGDHFDVMRAINEQGYNEMTWQVLADHGLTCYAISAHLVGQAVCDRIDERHEAILPPEIWGDGDPEGVRQHAAARIIDTAHACAKFMAAKPPELGEKTQCVVNGFTGSSIWHLLYSFPPVPPALIEAGYRDFADRWVPILGAFDALDVNFALEVHPTEIAFDIVSARRALAAVNNHSRFGFNYDPSHLGYQGVDYVRFLREFGAGEFGNRIFHVHMKDVQWGRGDGTVGVFGGHTEFCDPRRYWDFRSLGRGNIQFEPIICALNDIGYQGPLSVEWEDGRMDREHGATEACQFVKSLDFPRSAIKFDAQFEKKS